MAFHSTEGNGGPPIVLSREPVENPPFRRAEDGRFMVDFAQTINVVDIQSGTIATVIARIGSFICTFHHAHYTGWYTGTYGRMLAADTVVTWERFDG